MGGYEGDTDPALQSFVTGGYAPSAEGGTAFFFWGCHGVDSYIKPYLSVCMQYLKSVVQHFIR